MPLNWSLWVEFFVRRKMEWRRSGKIQIQAEAQRSSNRMILTEFLLTPMDAATRQQIGPARMPRQKREEQVESRSDYIKAQEMLQNCKVINVFVSLRHPKFELLFDSLSLLSRGAHCARKSEKNFPKAIVWRCCTNPPSFGMELRSQQKRRKGLKMAANSFRYTRNSRHVIILVRSHQVG